MEACERTRADRSMVARKRYFDDGQAPLGEVPGSVLRSWQRCLEAGQQAERSIAFELISRGRIRDIDERNRALVDAASPEVRELAQAVSNARMIVLLTDASGTVVETGGNLAAVSPRLRLAARKGVDMSEASIGTNAVGTALFERGPVEVIAREHYYEANAVHTCAAVPLFAPDSSLVGALDVSGDYCPDRPNFIDLVAASARAIENRMLHALRGVALLAFSPREDLLGTPWEAILAFDPAGTLVGGNTAARGLLGMLATRRSARFEDLFESTYEQALRGMARGKGACTLQSWSGVRVVTWLHEHSARPHGIAVSSRAGQSDASAKRNSTLAFLDMVSEDKATADAVARARRAYDQGLPTLLVGETGTGKELVARALHYRGARCDAPFIAVNCASLPESLVEAELFGYVDGAFTGARRGGAQGRLELANAGTLLLDEIGDMPLASQAKLLRVLQERCVIRLGDTRERPLDVALVCATHQDLPQLIAQRVFREDLYYRINGLSVTLPPLRSRSNIVSLARHLLRQQSQCELSERAVQLLVSHPWPGNLRQLSHVVTSTMALAGAGCVIEPEHFPEDFVAQASGSSRCDSTQRGSALQLATIDEAEAELIERTIKSCRGNMSAAARALGVSRSTLYNKLKRN